ncbi:NACHT domain-containing protein [Streptomyces ficellus]|nr:NACHT domain-containing protein [Streptomyces ficellus]
MRERRAIAKRAETVTFDGAANVDQALRNLSAYDRDRMLEFTTTAEFENICYQVAIAACVSTDPSPHLSKLRDTLRLQMRRYAGVPDTDLETVTDALFHEIRAIAWREVTRHQKEGGVKKRAYTPEIIASYVAAAARNADLHTQLLDMRNIDEFSRQLSRQCALVHGRIRPAQTESGARVPFEDLFVEPSLLRGLDREPLRSGGLAVRDAVTQAHRVVILGDPGGGKTTLALKLTLDVASGRGTVSAPQTPLRVVLHDYANRFRDAKESIVQFLEKQCAALYSTKAPTGCIEYLLLNGRAVVIFDGLDELTDTSLRTQIVDAVEAFAHAYPTTPILVTSRRVGYEMAPLDDHLFLTYFLSPFDTQQQRSYVNKWFGRMRGDSHESGADLARRFMVEAQHASDLISNPLMLGLMCALYRGEGYIPRNRPDLYRRCSEFLFERWDASRGISVVKPFERGIQFAMFSLALTMLRTSDDSSGMTECELVRFTSDFLLEERYEDRDSADAAARAFVEYCRGRAWVLTDVGTNPEGERIYSFTHRTFLEYFSARQLVRDNGDAPGLYRELRECLKNETWDVTAQLAIQFLDERLGNAANDFVAMALAEARTVREEGHRNALVTFCARILEFIALKPAVVREIVRQLRSLDLSQGANIDMVVAAWAGLGMCATETRHVVSDELLRCSGDLASFDEIKWAISMREWLPRYAVHDVRDFWARQDRMNAVTLQDSLRRMAPEDIRAAVVCVLLRFVPIREAVTWHGTALFFSPDYNVNWTRMHRNLIFEVAYVRDRWLEAEVEEIAGEVIDFLLSRPTPWTDGRHGALLFPAHLSNGKNVTACRVLFWIYGVEGEHASLADGDLPPFLKDLTRVRFGASPVEVLHKYADLVRPEHFDFFLRWAQGDFSLVRGRTRAQ